MQRTTARGQWAEEGVRFPVDVSGLSEELGREALEALREAVWRRRVAGGGEVKGAAGVATLMRRCSLLGPEEDRI